MLCNPREKEAAGSGNGSQVKICKTVGVATKTQLCAKKISERKASHSWRIPFPRVAFEFSLCKL